MRINTWTKVSPSLWTDNPLPSEKNLVSLPFFSEGSGASWKDFLRFAAVDFSHWTFRWSLTLVFTKLYLTFGATQAFLGELVFLPSPCGEGRNTSCPKNFCVGGCFSVGEFLFRLRKKLECYGEKRISKLLGYINFLGVGSAAEYTLCHT